MEDMVNIDYSNDIVLRVSPKNNSFIVEEHKKNGVIAYKEISPIELYYAINGSYIASEFLSSGVLPEHCIHLSMSNSEKRFILWYPELRTEMTYKDEVYASFPIPRLVFGVRMLQSGKVAECSIGVVADEAPTTETVMYYYPFSNVYDDGRVCTGNNVLPSYKKQTALKNFPSYLLGIPDNDDMFRTEHNKLHLGHKELMEHLKDKSPEYYYTDVLVANGKTLGDFINANRR